MVPALNGFQASKNTVIDLNIVTISAGIESSEIVRQLETFLTRIQWNIKSIPIEFLINTIHLKLLRFD